MGLAKNPRRINGKHLVGKTCEKVHNLEVEEDLIRKN